MRSIASLALAERRQCERRAARKHAISRLDDGTPARRNGAIDAPARQNVRSGRPVAGSGAPQPSGGRIGSGEGERALTAAPG
ncbi:MAG TPA: hypothetical protein VGM56_15740, partial [Byssovorax sp.]